MHYKSVEFTTRNTQMRVTLQVRQLRAYNIVFIRYGNNIESKSTTVLENLVG